MEQLNVVAIKFTAEEDPSYIVSILILTQVRLLAKSDC